MTARGSLSQAGLLTRLAAADPAASRAQRQVWLILLLDWVRHAPGAAAPAEPSAPVEHAPELPAVQRVRQLLAVLAHDDAQASRVRATLATFWRDADLPALMADYGFTYQRSLTSELSTRLRERLVPATPDTDDLATLFPLLFEPLDPHWIDALDDGLLAALTGWVAPPDDVDWRAQAVLAIAMLASAMRAAAYAQALRRRMDPARRHDDPFRTLPLEVEALRDALAEGRTDDALRTANLLRARLDHCRKATDSIVQHLEAHGVSVNVVYQMDQMHARAERIELLLALVLSPSPAREAMGLLGSLLRVLRERRGIRPLLARQYSLLARQVAERSAEVGEHYIARDDTAYRQMLQRAAGGGLVLAGTTLTKFALGTLGLSAFWAGFAAGTN